jgi:hypothetical protein
LSWRSCSALRSLAACRPLHFLDVVMNMNYRGAAAIDCDAPFRKGDELGWFEHGSTIIVFAPAGFRLCSGVRDARRSAWAARSCACPDGAPMRGADGYGKRRSCESRALPMRDAVVSPG